MSIYPENTLFNSMSKNALNLGKSLKRDTPISNRFPKLKRTMNRPVSKSFTDLGRISTPYGGSTRYESFHPGVDIANKRGTPIKPFMGGKVSAIESNPTGFGNSVIIKDAYGGQQRYSHLKQAFVKVGQTVTPTTNLGPMGYTGSSYAPSGGDPSHLDYRIKDSFGKYVNPSSYLSKYNKNL